MSASHSSPVVPDAKIKSFVSCPGRQGATTTSLAVALRPRHALPYDDALHLDRACGAAGCGSYSPAGIRHQARAEYPTCTGDVSLSGRHGRAVYNDYLWPVSVMAVALVPTRNHVRRSWPEGVLARADKRTSLVGLPHRQ